MTPRVRAALERRTTDARATGRTRGEDGFVLLESMVAISMITVILGALATFTIDAVAATSEFRARQGAAQLATSAMASLGSVPATDLVTGRDPASVAAQFQSSSVPDEVEPWLASMSQVSDSAAAAGAGATASVPTSEVTQTLNNTSYSVETYLGSCQFQSDTSTNCVATGTGTTYLRAVVSVLWTGGGCTTDLCTYVSATLVSADGDPVFNTNRATPPVRPVVTSPGDQVNTVGAPVSLQLTVDDNTGVPPLTWTRTGTLPVGLSMSASGLISGTPTVVTAATPLTVTVSDAFGRTGTADFTWRIVAAPTITTPAAQSTQQNQAVSLAVASTCPNSPCRFVLANAPAGLSINASTGAITGTPTTAGIYSNVWVSITDVDNVAATTAGFTWTVLPSATIESPGDRGVTEGQTESVPIPYTCPTTPCTVTLTGTVPGLGLSTSASNTTNNTTLTLTVSTTTGTLYLAGTVQTTAVTSGTSRGYTPTVTITKGSFSATASGAWTAYTRPTIGAVGTRNATVGSTKNIAIAYTCAYTPCILSLTNPVPGLGLSTTSGETTANTTTSLTLSSTSGTVYINGKVTSDAVPTEQTTKAYAVTLTITDADAATATSTGTWTATREPKITVPGSQALEPNQTLGLQMSALCPNGGCSWSAAVQASGSSTWSTVTISTAGKITYSTSVTGTYTLRVTVTDADGISDTVTFPLYVQTFTLSIPTQSTSRPSSGTKVVTLDVSDLVRPLADAYTFSMSGAPGWLSINSSTGVLTATLTSSSATDTSITVTVRSSASTNSAVATSFRWNITS